MLAFRNKPQAVPFDNVPALRHAFRDVFRSLATILTDKDIRDIWDKHQDAPHPVVRQVRTLDSMMEAVLFLRQHAEFDDLRRNGVSITAIVLDPATSLVHA